MKKLFTFFLSLAISIGSLFAQEGQTYAVTFKDFNGMVIKAEKVAYGQPAMAPAEPVHPGLTFTGWDIPFDNVTGNLVITAQFEKNTYRMNYLVDDQPYAYDSFAYDAPVTLRPEPQRDFHKFSGWSKAPAFMPDHDFVLVGSFTQVGFTVTFNDWDGTLLKTQMVNPGKSAVAPNTPAREGYVFVGWNKSFSYVTGDMTTTAQYREINSTKYTVVFYDWDGTVLSMQSVNYQEDATPPAAPTRRGYTFIGWDQSYTHVTSSYSIYAMYQSNPVCTVTFLDWNGGTIYQAQVYQGQSVTTAPTELLREGYIFTGWDASLDNITEDMTVNAQYQPIIYDVMFKDWAGVQILTQTVTWDETPAAPAAPLYDGYSFFGWDRTFDHVRTNLIVTALYHINYYRLNYNIGGNEYAFDSLAYSALIEPIEAPYYEGYKFHGWYGLPDFMPDHDVTVYGAYNEIGTAIENIEHSEPAKTHKLLRNGQILILRGDRTYTLTGQEVR